MNRPLGKVTKEGMDGSKERTAFLPMVDVDDVKLERDLNNHIYRTKQ